MGVDAQLFSTYLHEDLPEREELTQGHYVKATHLLRKRGFTSVFSIRAAVFASRDIFRSERVHISFAREPIPIWAAAIAIVMRRTLILQPHGMLTIRDTWKHRLFDRMISKPLFRRASRVIALSSTEATQLKTWSGAGVEIHELGNPVPRQAFEASKARTNPAGGPVRIIFVARLHPRKRVSDFVQAAHIARAEKLPWEWIVAGPDEGELGVVQEGMNQNRHIRYVGGVPAAQIVRELGSSAVYVMPSENEPWGNVLASALTMGIPVVVTKSAALSPSVEHYEAGRVIEDHNPRSIVDAIRELLEGRHYEAASGGARKLARELLDPSRQQQKLIDIIFGDSGRDVRAKRSEPSFEAE